MKTDWTHLEPNRLRNTDYASKTGDTFGFFIFQKGKAQIRAMACDALETGWEHVSVSVKYQNAKGKIIDRCPTWEEMHEIKRIFWDDTECVMQLHPPQENYISNCDSCLHLWRPTGTPIPTPPTTLV